jgi:5-methylthioribose kinase
VEPAGTGNINWVRRVRSLGDGSSWVVKQARPALERFPEYRAPTERALFESRYFETAAPFDREGVCIGVVFFDERERVLVLEDLGDADPLSSALARGPAAEVASVACSLGAFLGAVHAGTRGRSLAQRFENDAMRRLHGDHIFHLPYRPNEFTLSPAVAARADALQRDAALIETIDAAYERYLRPEGALIHADVQPDNVLLTPRGPRLLDAEIAHVGDPAFDVGILVAHLLLAAVAHGDESSAPIEETWSAYARAHGERGLPHFRDVARYAGIELLRRTIGAARVEAVARDAAALEVIEAGVRWITTPPDAPGRG